MGGGRLGRWVKVRGDFRNLGSSGRGFGEFGRRLGDGIREGRGWATGG